MRLALRHAKPHVVSEDALRAAELADSPTYGATGALDYPVMRTFIIDRWPVVRGSMLAPHHPPST